MDPVIHISHGWRARRVALRPAWDAVIIEKLPAIIVNGLCKLNAPNSNTRFNYNSCDRNATLPGLSTTSMVNMKLSAGQ